MKKNVLICGIKDFGNRQENQYFMTKKKNKIKLCDSLVAGEGEAKTILSSVDIDEIVAIGSTNQCLFETDEEDLPVSPSKMKLNDGMELFVPDTDSFSDFDFFRYRLTQFVEGIDIDTADFIDLIEPTRRQQIVSMLKSIFGDDLSQALVTFVCVEGVRNKLLEQMKAMTQEEAKWIRRYLFSVLDRNSKMTAKSHNAWIPISFVPIMDNRDHKVLNRFHNLIKELLVEDNTEIDLYIDLHGFTLEDSFVCIQALFALHDDPNCNIRIKDVTDETVALSGYVYEISLSSARYRVQKLMTGIHSFLKNGKTDILREYWAESKEQNPGQKNEYIDQMLLAMSYIDAGISLCSIGELEKGIYGLRKLLNRPMDQTDVKEEGEALFMALKEGIIQDYGPLIEKEGEEIDSFELIKWAYNKKFYQQVITLIESRIPHEMVSRGIFYPVSDEAEKTAYLKAMNYQYWDCLSKDRYIFRDMEHYFIKTYGRFAVDYKDRKTDKNTEYALRRAEQVFGSPEKKNLLRAHSLLKDRALFTELFDRYYHLSGVRNTINHALKHEADLQEALISESRIWNDVRNMIGDFINCYQKVLDTIGNQTFEQEMITSDEFHNYVFFHGPKKDPGFRNVPGYTPYNRRDKGHERTKKTGRNQRDSYRNRCTQTDFQEGRQKETKGLEYGKERPNINLVLDISQKKGIGGFFQKLFGGKQNSQVQSDQIVLDTEDKSSKNQSISQGDIHIHIKID